MLNFYALHTVNENMLFFFRAPVFDPATPTW